MSPATEARLTDALTAVGDTLGPADVPPLRLERRHAMRPGLIVTATAGLAAVAAAGLVVVFNPFDAGRSSAPVGVHASAAVPAMRTEVAVFLCVHSSANPNCNHSAATPGQKSAIEARVKRLPGVASFTYESQEQALARFKRGFASQSITADVKVGDIPDSYRVTFSNPGDASRALPDLQNMPGVDQVVKESGR